MDIDRNQNETPAQRDEKAKRRAHWAYVLAAFLKEQPSLCNELQGDLERAGIKTGLDERQHIDAFADVLDYVMQMANVNIEGDLSHYDEHEQGEIVFERLIAAL
jgi:hypothetical protein